MSVYRGPCSASFSEGRLGCPEKKQIRGIWADICGGIFFFYDFAFIGQSKSEEADRKCGERDGHDMQ